MYLQLSGQFVPAFMATDSAYMVLFNAPISALLAATLTLQDLFVLLYCPVFLL